MNYINVDQSTGKIINFDPLLHFITTASTYEDIPTLLEFAYELSTYTNIDVFQKMYLLNQIKDRINNLYNEQNNFETSTILNSKPPRSHSLTKLGTQPRSHSQEYDDSTPPTNSRGFGGQNAAFIAQALLIAGIGLTVIMYALLFYANVIK